MTRPNTSRLTPEARRLVDRDECPYRIRGIRGRRVLFRPILPAKHGERKANWACLPGEKVFRFFLNEIPRVVFGEKFFRFVGRERSSGAGQGCISHGIA